MGIDRIERGVRDRDQPHEIADDLRVVCDPGRTDAAPLYQNHHDRLGIAFTVHRVPLADLAVLEPRLVTIGPGKQNEHHRHAHESLFYVIRGTGELHVGARVAALAAGQLAMAPRWAFHHAVNTSAVDDLVLLAITDVGLTRAVLGDYDRATRLAHDGADVQAVV